MLLILPRPLSAFQFAARVYIFKSRFSARILEHPYCCTKQVLCTVSMGPFRDILDTFYPQMKRVTDQHAPTPDLDARRNPRHVAEIHGYQGIK